MAITIIAVGALVFLAHLFSALFEKTRIPDVLPLIFLGLLIGPVTGLVPPETFGKLGGVFTTIALLVILFESGLEMNVAALRTSMLQGSRLAVISFTVTMIVVAAVAIPLLGLTVMEGLLLGAILGGTSSAVVIPIIERMQLDTGVSTALVLESTFTDVLCIVISLGLLQAVQFHSLRPGLMLGQIIASFAMASVIGAAGALFWASVLERVRQLENSLFTTPAFVFIVFGIAEFLGFSGAIASLAFGFFLGSMNDLRIPFPFKVKSVRLNETEKAVFSEAVFLIKTFFFVYLGLSIQLTDLSLAWVGLFVVIMVYVSRIPVIYGSLENAKPMDASIAAAMMPKGLAAAVLASLPLQAGLASGAAIRDVAYSVVLFSIVLAAGLAFLIEKGYFKNFFEKVFSAQKIGIKEDKA